MAMYWVKYLVLFIGGWAFFVSFDAGYPGFFSPGEWAFTAHRVPEGDPLGDLLRARRLRLRLGPDERALLPAVRRLPPLPAPGHDEAAAVPGRCPLFGGTAHLARRRALRARTSSCCCARSSRREMTPDAALADRRAGPAARARATRRSSSPRAPSTTGSTLVCLAVAPRATLWIAGCKAVWCAIWFWAASRSSTATSRRSSMVMMNNGPFFPTWLQKRLFASYPDDLRPSRLAAVMAHVRHASSSTAIPLVLLLASTNRHAHGADARRDVRLPRLHRDQQPERRADRVEHPDDLRRLLPVRRPPRGELLATLLGRRGSLAFLFFWLVRRAAARQPRPVARLVPARDALLRRQLGLQHLALPQGQRRRSSTSS